MYLPQEYETALKTKEIRHDCPDAVEYLLRSNVISENYLLSLFEMNIFFLLIVNVIFELKSETPFVKYIS